MGNTTKDCTYAKDLLNQENDCLYTIISDENVRNASQICGAKALQEQTITPSKDFNEE
jgi:hypothetical protein